MLEFGYRGTVSHIENQIFPLPYGTLWKDCVPPLKPVWYIPYGYGNESQSIYTKSNNLFIQRVWYIPYGDGDETQSFNIEVSKISLKI